MTMPSAHPLDYPIWSALTGRQAALAEGNSLAKRMPAAIGPFAALANSSPEAFAQLLSLLPAQDYVVLFTPEPVTLPDGFTLLGADTGEQMVGTPVIPDRPMPDIVPLTREDVLEMISLVELTKPGPFGPRTIELGGYVGVKIDGRLAAMAGERLRPGNYTEMSAICVHPDFRGKGLAQALLWHVSQRIITRGETPFLHVFSGNASAISLYQRQGMTIRRRIHVTVLSRADSAPQELSLPHR